MRIHEAETACALIDEMTKLRRLGGCGSSAEATLVGRLRRLAGGFVQYDVSDKKLMDYDTVKQDISEIFEDVMDVEDVALEDDTNADDVEEWDSLSHVRLIIAIERRFGVKFSNAEIDGLNKFGDIVDLVLTKRAS